MEMVRLDLMILHYYLVRKFKGLHEKWLTYVRIVVLPEEFYQ